MEYLPAELTIDILSRLPVTTTIYCKCVCKKWRNLLLESSFVHLHLSRLPTVLIVHRKPINIIDTNVNSNHGISIDRNDPGVLEWVEIQDKDDYHHLQHEPLMSLDLNLAPILQKSEIHLNGCVNGLICLWQSGPSHDNTYICNPVTREYMILPKQHYYRKGKTGIVYGFGVSSRTGEYKVIRTLRSYKNHSLAEVYTLGTGQWRSLGHVPYQFHQSYDSDGSFLNNHCHWIVYDDNDNGAPGNICTFDLDKETFQLFPYPPPYVEEEEGIQDSEYPYECLAIIKGYLCKMDFYESQFTIWVMKEYGIKESWHKEVVINQAISPYLDWSMWRPLNLIEGLKDGSILTLYRSKLWAFYPNNKTIQDTGLFDFSSFSPVSGLAYRPSFLKLQSFESERVHMF